ncbi:hypothetical protein AMTR_s00011p00266070 [Amborella trichopoda]|uniref:Uncharacterized protein n=1 Tax=Amborella trichopoda TaxID=13333 RepID=W1NH40_AMBTC|nr:hypothetical protein AMTR_s00011p00266070 [Amborella trichopoda]
MAMTRPYSLQDHTSPALLGPNLTLLPIAPARLMFYCNLRPLCRNGCQLIPTASLDHYEGCNHIRLVMGWASPGPGPSPTPISGPNLVRQLVPRKAGPETEEKRRRKREIKN